jgi:hypothetical protein
MDLVIVASTIDSEGTSVTSDKIDICILNGLSNLAEGGKMGDGLWLVETSHLNWHVISPTALP